MGYYINPTDMSKEDFLTIHGRPVSMNEAKLTDRELPVLLVDNGMFTAAAIAYSDKEFQYFCNPSDHRFKTFYMVGRDVLAPFMA